MTTQPEALLCAEMLEVARDTPTWADYSEIPKEACRRSAAELRRLHAECNDLARQLNESNERNGRLIAQRDALLEACEAMLFFIERHAPRGLQPEPGSPVALARAAIKMVEGGK